MEKDLLEVEKTPFGSNNPFRQAYKEESPKHMENSFSRMPRFGSS